jgi:hypothetical protein
MKDAKRKFSEWKAWAAKFHKKLPPSGEVLLYPKVLGLHWTTQLESADVAPHEVI